MSCGLRAWKFRLRACWRAHGVFCRCRRQSYMPVDLCAQAVRLQSCKYSAPKNSLFTNNGVQTEACRMNEERYMQGVSQEDIYRGKSSEALSSVVYDVACVAKVRGTCSASPINMPEMCSGIAIFEDHGMDGEVSVTGRTCLEGVLGRWRMCKHLRTVRASLMSPACLPSLRVRQP